VGRRRARRRKGIDKRIGWAGAAGIVLWLASGVAWSQSGADGALWENRHLTKHMKTYEGP